MKVFINQADSFLGRQLGASLTKVPEVEEGTEAEEGAEVHTVSGTLAGDSKPPFVSTAVDADDEDSLRSALREADVIVYDLHGQNDEARFALEELTEWANSMRGVEENEDKKTFILVSSPLAWGKPGAQAARIDAKIEAKKKDAAEGDAPAGDDEDGEGPVTDVYTETEFKVRRPHPQYVEYKATETMALKANRDPLKCYIVMPGLLYGQGEDIFHSLFRNAWELDPPFLPLLGEGKNVVPTIHVKDLVSIVSKCALEKPETQEPYVLAVDRSNHTLEELVTGISTRLGCGAVTKLNRDDVILFPNRELFQLDLTMSGATAVEWLGDPEPVEGEAPATAWHSPMGMLASMDATMAEYRDTRTLTPIRALISGPPASGKTYYSEMISGKYRVNHVTAASAVEAVMAATPASPEDPLKALQDEMADLADDNPDHSKVTPPPELLAKIVRYRLKMPPCQNQGYVLDGYPRTKAEAQLLFGIVKAEGEEEEEAEADVDADADGEERPKKDKLDETITPNHIIALEGATASSAAPTGAGGADDAADAAEAAATDEEASREALANLLRERLKAIPESSVEGADTTHEGFEARLAEYELDRKEEDKLVTPYFADRNPLDINILTEDVAQVMQAVTVCIGREHNYGKSQEEVEAERETELMARLQSEEVVRKEQAEADAKEATERAATQEMEAARLAAIEGEERELLEERSKPLREYLMRNVIPTLTEGLIEVCKRKPEDPIDFLSEYLFEQSE